MNSLVVLYLPVATALGSLLEWFPSQAGSELRASFCKNLFSLSFELAYYSRFVAVLLLRKLIDKLKFIGHRVSVC